MIDGDTIEEITDQTQDITVITTEEYAKYKNTNIWDELPRVEFEMISYLPE